MAGRPSPEVASIRGRVAGLSRDRSPDDPDLVQARRALDLARTEATIRTAIEQAPPLDGVTLARLHSLIPAADGELAEAGGPDAA